LSSAVIFVAIALGTPRGNKRSREAWSSFELVIGENFVVGRIRDFPEPEIQQNKVTAIKENADGLRIETATRGRGVSISSGLVGYRDARERLSRWMPVQELRGWRTSSRWAYVSSVLSMFLLVSFLLATKSWAIIATGVAIVFLFASPFITNQACTEFQRNEFRLARHRQGVVTVSDHD